MKIALAQIDIVPGLPEANFKKILAVYKALSTKVDLLAFPELAIPGYFVGDAWERESFLRDCEFYTHELARHTKDTAIVFGSVGVDWELRNEDGRVRKYNAAFCAQNGRLIPHPTLNRNFWVKTLSPNYRMFDETRYFMDLRKLAVERKQDIRELLSPLIITRGKKSCRIGLNICEDAWDENYSLSPIRELTAQGIDLVLNISSSPFTLQKSQRRNRLFHSFMRDVHVPILYVNCIGTQNLGNSIYVFDGSSAVYRHGEDEYRAQHFEENVLVYQSDNDNCECFSLAYKGAEAASIHPEEFGSLPVSETAELYEALTKGLRLLLDHWKISNVTIGVSGGIDSALAACLYTQVLGARSVGLVNMPSQFNSSLTKAAAKQLAENLRTPFAELPIESFFQNTSKQLSTVEFTHGISPLNLDSLTLENIQARDRSSRILAGIASARKGVFTCNANKTEFTVGYCTLYGDEAGFLAALGDLWKHQVYALARYINKDIVGDELIPQATLDLVPSAELSADQDIAEGLGDPLIYAYHDALFKTWVEDWERKSPEDLLHHVLENSVQSILPFHKQDMLAFFKNDVHAFVNDLEHWWSHYVGMGAIKRVQAPPILALSRRAFGSDHRESIGPMSLSRKYFELKHRLLGSA